ncbi:pentatricopeptide repeat-containing protein, mitochondrial-like [Heracleum sosnowskyi]|uniref:Pentatricopeptide repeat-containing protein, mitochondrial-like n=1 Tax=Heracleum sosnowskyi TaxID=360622 RepID=A0AAD8H444_9APIA|nr:pentatricopeptide repeat-containing protein, mitochondrial-like [Heracleum sosnowskyi]
MSMNLKNTISRTIRHRFTRPDQQLLHGSSLPLSTLLHSPHNFTFTSPYCKISCFLSHPTSLSFLQESRLFKNCAFFDCNVGFKGSFGLFNFVGFRKDLIFRPRGFCSVGGNEGCSDLDEGQSGSVLESEKSEEDLREVERVCKVIEESFALDRNMEVGLDECGIRLSHSLVVDVLERFKHASNTAFRFFCWVGNQAGFIHDSRTYNAMLMIMGKMKEFGTMSTLVEEMGEKGVLDVETFQIVIQAFADSQVRMKAVEIFDLIEKYKVEVDVKTVNCLLDAFGRAKLVKEALVLFWKLEQRFTPDLLTYTVLINGWCKVRNFDEARRVWREMIDKGFKPDVVAYNTMLRGFLDDKKVSNAIKLFEVMKTEGPTPNVQSYSIMIRDFCKQKMMDRAVEYFEEMVDYGCEPDTAVYTCLITGFGNLNKMDKVFGLQKQMKERGCPPNVQMYNALIKLMTSRKMRKDAVSIYKEMVQCGIQPNIDTYNIMMKSYFETRNFDMGFAAWEEMNQKGCCPNYISYNLFIGGLVKQGRSVEACKYLEEMIEKGMKAPQIDYNKFSADCSRANKPQILEELAQKTRFSGRLEVSDYLSRRAENKGGVKSREV